MQWHTPPENQGQIVEVSYACDRADYFYMRSHDRSDRTTQYWRVDRDALTQEQAEAFEPWNREPAIASADWEPCEEPGDDD